MAVVGLAPRNMKSRAFHVIIEIGLKDRPNRGGVLSTFDERFIHSDNVFFGEIGKGARFIHQCRIGTRVVGCIVAVVA